jgi:hypothetical protein
MYCRPTMKRAEWMFGMLDDYAECVGDPLVDTCLEVQGSGSTDTSVIPAGVYKLTCTYLNTPVFRYCCKVN